MREAAITFATIPASMVWARERPWMKTEPTMIIGKQIFTPAYIAKRVNHPWVRDAAGTGFAP
jgi:hypothetical protein